MGENKEQAIFCRFSKFQTMGEKRMKPNPCHNRPPFKPFVTVQDGWYATDNFTRHARMITIPFRMAPDCRYQAHDQYADPGCVGCKWKTQSGAEAPQ